MSRETYLRFLRAYLSNRLPAEEVEDILQYYTEYFEDAGPDREREVMAELGSPEHLAQQILGERSREALAPADPAGAAWQEPEVAAMGSDGLPYWAFLLLLAAAAVFVGPVLLGLVLGFGLGGAICVLVGLWVALGGFGRLGIFGLLCKTGGGLIVIGVGLLLLLGASLLVRGTARLIRGFRDRYVEGGDGYETQY